MCAKDKLPLKFGFHRSAIDDKNMSFRLSWINVYMLACAVILIIGISAWLLVAYTPFVEWIGTGHKVQDKRIKAIQNRLNEMRDRIDAQNTYIAVLKSKLDGEEFISESVTEPDTGSGIRALERVDRVALDDSLRQRVRKGNLNIPTRTPTILNVSDPGNLEDSYLMPPITGVVRMAYDANISHYGVDIIAPANSAVKCTLDGQVIESDWTLEGGNTIIVQHDYNLLSIYKHNSALLKKKGDHVKAGEALAIIGNTGLHTDGPHVHFELWLDGEPLDPAAYIELEYE